MKKPTCPDCAWEFTATETEYMRDEIHENGYQCPKCGHVFMVHDEPEYDEI